MIVIKSFNCLVDEAVFILYISVIFTTYFYVSFFFLLPSAFLIANNWL